MYICSHTPSLWAHVLVTFLQVAGSCLIPLYHMTAHHAGHNWIGILSSPKAVLWRLVKSLWGAWQETFALRGILFLGGAQQAKQILPKGVEGIWTASTCSADRMNTMNRGNQWVQSERRRNLILTLPGSWQFDQEGPGVVSGAGEAGFGSWLCSFLPVWS